MHRPLAALAITALLALTTPAWAQSSLDDYDKSREALLQVWSGLPLSVRNVTLVKESVPSYGDFEPRGSQSYKPTDEIHVYVEVLGYGWKDNGDGTLSELLDADLQLLDAQGNLLGHQDGFLNADIRSRSKLLETYLNLSATLSSFEAGGYKLQFVLHDRAAGKEVTFAVPVTLLGADASEPDASSAQ